jgi:uncharacterized membrane protein
MFARGVHKLRNIHFVRERLHLARRLFLPADQSLMESFDASCAGLRLAQALNPARKITCRCNVPSARLPIQALAWATHDSPFLVSTFRVAAVLSRRSQKRAAR